MKNIAVVNLLDITDFFYQDIDGKPQIERIKSYCASLPNVKEVVFLINKENLNLDLDNTVLNNLWTEELLINVLSDKCGNYDHLFYLFGNSPLLDKELSLQMFNDHINYYAEYTFADGYPIGLAPEILDTNILSALILLSKDSKELINRSTIFNIVKKDINSFELETKISEVDLRLLRVSLTTDTKRNFNQLQRIIKLGGNNTKSITEVLINHPEILIQEPSYISIEITNKNFQNVTYLPKRKHVKDFMELEILNSILLKIKNYCDDTTIAFTPESEPTTHPELLKIIELVTKKYNFDLYIETSGLGWTDEIISEIISNKKVKLIITLDALNPEIYENLRGLGQEEAYNFTKQIINSKKDETWVQATRMVHNEVDMEPFYRYWQKFTDQIIIQKYSNYNERLPNLKIADLSPLKRFPCWHLKKDMHINTLGDVLLCFNDINNETILGSLVSEEIEVIMEKKKLYYIEHINCNYKNHCRTCDEYYTFNF